MNQQMFALGSLLLALHLLAMPAWTRSVQKRELPVPETVSAPMREQIEREPSPWYQVCPQTPEQWNVLKEQRNKAVAPLIPALLEKYGVSSQKTVMGGVPVFVLTPKEIAPENKDKIFLHIHGGGYVLFPGEAGTGEGILFAGLNHAKVISVDYRMLPEHPYPAAVDDVLAVYKALLEQYKPQDIGVFGTSTGGGLALILALRARDEHLPLPGAIAALTPWTDLAKVGDSYFANAWVDNVLVSYEGWLGAAAKAYANGESFKNSYLSPVYGDWQNMPPVLLVSGTRDLFLSNTVRMHQKLREANVPADLLVYEGQSHAQYDDAPDSTECRYHFEELRKFFQKNLGK